MKKLIISLLLVLVAGWFHSCEEEATFDETLLYGRWRPEKGTKLYFRYDSSYEGVTWNPDADQQESEGQKFTWKLVRSNLSQIHLMEIGDGKIPKNYTVTKLTATTLNYKDRFSSYSFSRID